MNIFFTSFFDQYETILYYSQYYFAKFILFANISNFFLLFIIFIILGIITVFTPCFLSILPLSLSYISYKDNALVEIMLFIGGILTSFSLVVFSANTVTLPMFFVKLPFLSSIFILLFSLDLIGIIDLSKVFIVFNSFFYVFHDNNSLLQSYFTGVIAGFSSLPCNTSILLIISFLVKNIYGALDFFLYLLAYLIGLIVPLIIILSFRLYSLNFNLFSSFWFLFNRFAAYVLFIVSFVSILKSIIS